MWNFRYVASCQCTKSFGLGIILDFRCLARNAQPVCPIKIHAPVWQETRILLASVFIIVPNLEVLTSIRNTSGRLVLSVDVSFIIFFSFCTLWNSFPLPFFCALGLKLHGFMLAKQAFSYLSHSASPFLCVWDAYFQDMVSGTICPGWFWTAVFQISASQVARITGMSHWRLALSVFNRLQTSAQLRTSNIFLEISD
jgi:hypothetical protein